MDINSVSNGHWMTRSESDNHGAVDEVCTLNHDRLQSVSQECGDGIKTDRLNIAYLDTLLQRGNLV